MINLDGTVPKLWTPAAWYSTLIEADWDASDVVLTGSKVSTWTDKTGRHSATQTNDTYRPTVATGSDFGGKQVVHGAGGGIGLTLSTAISLATAHVFWIGKVGSAPQHAIWGLGSASNVCYYNLSGSNYEHFGTSSRLTTAVGSRDLTTAHCYEVISKSGSYATKYNGASWGSRATNTVGWRATQCLLCDSIGAANTISQDVARIIVCSSEITGADLTKLKAYLNKTYSLSIA